MTIFIQTDKPVYMQGQTGVLHFPRLNEILFLMPSNFLTLLTCDMLQ